MSTIYKAVTTFVFGFILILTSFICQAQETDAGCGRTYFMGKCENLALPDDWEEQSRDYYDCLGEQNSFDLEKCKHLLPDYGRKFSIYSEEAMFSNIRTWIPSILHHDRFAMIQPSYVITSTIEYFFEATYDCARDPVIKEREDQNGNPIEDELYPSYLNLRLYFDGEQRASREFNRILVSADEGEITNGEKSEAGSEYRVFRLNEQPVTVKYKAPKKGSAGSDRITVYNSCEILPTEKSPLRTTNPDKQIASHELRLNHQGWTGTINLEITERFQCNAEKQTSELGRREVRADDEKIYKANLTIGMDDFDLAVQPAIAANNLLKEVSGQLNYSYDEDHFTAGRAMKAWCQSTPQHWESPGNWNTKNETWSGQTSRQIKKENINLLIAKDQNLDKASMQDLQKQMQEAAKNMDMDAINKLKGQMVGMVQGDQESNSIPIIIRVEIVFDITEKDHVIKTYENKSYDACLGRFSEDESGTDIIELPIAMPMVMQMKGTYTRGKDGSDIITATINKTENSHRFL